MNRSSQFLAGFLGFVWFSRRPVVRVFRTNQGSGSWFDRSGPILTSMGYFTTTCSALISKKCMLFYYYYLFLFQQYCRLVLWNRQIHARRNFMVVTNKLPIIISNFMVVIIGILVIAKFWGFENFYSYPTIALFSLDIYHPIKIIGQCHHQKQTMLGLYGPSSILDVWQPLYFITKKNVER